MKLNMRDQIFDVTKPILDSLFSATIDGDLDDQDFTTCCKEYDMEEDDVMWEMVNSTKYYYTRHDDGWYVTKK